MMARQAARAGLLVSLAFCGGVVASHAQQTAPQPPTALTPLVGASQPVPPSPIAKLKAVVAKPTSRSSERECMARAMYFESEKSAEDGMLAVGTVVANRLKSGRYGNSVCGVVGAPQQFAPGVLSRSMTGAAAERARQMADAVLKGRRHPAAGEAMFFHVANVRFKYPNMHYVLVSGGNAFYEKRRQAAPFASMAKAIAAAKRDEALAQPIVQAALTTKIEPLRGETPLAYGGGDKPAPGTALAAVAAIKPKPAIRVIAPSAPVLASIAPVSAASAYPRNFAGEANELVASAWAPYW
jgi:spore germination cell wall hydrolase CwlJ-like protein